MACMYSREIVKCRIFVEFNISYSGLSVSLSSEHIYVLLLHFSKTYKVLVLENIFDILGDHFASGRVFIYLQTSGPKLVGVARVFIEIIFSIFSIFSKFSYFRMLIENDFRNFRIFECLSKMIFSQVSFEFSNISKILFSVETLIHIYQGDPDFR